METSTKKENIRLVVEALLKNGFTMKSSNETETESEMVFVAEILPEMQVTTELTIKTYPDSQGFHEISLSVGNSMPIRDGMTLFFHDFNKGNVSTFLLKMRINCEDAIIDYLRNLQRAMYNKFADGLFADGQFQGDASVNAETITNKKP